MTYPVVVRPGNRLSADVLNLGFLIGRGLFFATRDAAQAIPNSAVGSSATALSWDNPELDILAGWSASTPTRYTITIAGMYTLVGEVGFSGDSAPGTRRGASWLVNGSLATAATAVPYETTISTNETLTASARTLPVELDVDDYVELAPFQDSGADLNTATGSLRPHIGIRYDGPTT